MPRIIDYTASGGLKPQDRGIDAFVRAGRYEGAYYRQTATDLKDEGQLQSSAIRERAWPFDILALEQQSIRDESGGSTRRSSGFSGAGGGLGTASAGRQRAYLPHASTSRGASALGRAASTLSSDYAAPHQRGDEGTYHDPNTGTLKDVQSARAQAQNAQAAARADAARQKSEQRGYMAALKQNMINDAQLSAYNKGLVATAQTDADNLQNYYRQLTGDPNAGIPTGVNPGVPGSNFDANSNPIGGDWSPANDPSQDTSFGGYVVNQLKDWASGAADVITGANAGDGGVVPAADSSASVFSNGVLY